MKAVRRVVSVFGIDPFRIGGTETFARELSAQLQQRGWESVLCFLSEPPDDVRNFLTLPNVTIEVLKDSIDLNWNAAKGLGRILRRYRPEVLHLHFTGFLGVYPWIGKLCSVKKIFFTDHSSRPEGYVPRRAPIWKRGLVRLINMHLTKVTCVSNYGYRCMTTLGLLPEDRYKMIYNSVDLSRVEPSAARAAAFKTRFSIPQERVIVTQISWIIPEKGIPELLKAARQVVSSEPKVQFVFVGDGAYHEQYSREAEAMGLSDHVTWTGLIKDPFCDGVYDAADIVCQVSNWEEVFGWVIAEAMAYSKPVIGTNVGGIPELVIDQQSGFIVDRGDVRAMAHKILKLGSDPELRKRMGHLGAEMVAARFDLRANVEKLIDLYGMTNGSNNRGDS